MTTLPDGSSKLTSAFQKAIDDAKAEADRVAAQVAAQNAQGKGGYTGIFSSKSVSDKSRANSVTIFPMKKKQNGEGGHPPSPPHLLLAWENRFYLEVRDSA